MTRAEFEAEMTTLGRLKDFCWDNGCDLMEELYDSDSYDDVMRDTISSYINNGYPRLDEIQYYVDSFPTGYDWYRWDCGDYVGMDNDEADFYYDDVLDWAISNDIFDSEDEQDDDTQVISGATSVEQVLEARKDKYVVAEEDFTLSELFGI